MRLLMQKRRCLVLLIYFFLLTGFSNGQTAKLREVIWSSGLNIRSLAESFFGNANLWPVILSFNNVNSIGELKEGRKLLIPQGEILAILNKFSSTEKLISSAISAGAKIFAGEEIDMALSLFSKGLTERAANNWNTSSRLVGEAEQFAINAKNKTIKLRDQSADAYLSKREGTVQLRKPSLPNWSNAVLFNKLYEQDLTRTLSKSFAEITFSDLNQIRLNENSQAVILKSRINLLNNQTESRVRLEKGDAYARLFKTPKKQFDLNVEGVKTKINSELFWVDKQEEHLKVANYKGEISLEAKGSLVTLKENQGSMVPKGSAPTPPKNLLAPPKLISPAIFSTFYSGDVSVSWSSSPEASQYWLEIATDSRFSSLQQIVKNIYSTSHIFKNLPANVYYWRVASVDNLGFPGNFSMAFNFNVEVDTIPPFLTVLSLPDFSFAAEKVLNLKVHSEKDAALFVNNKEYPVDSAGFSFINFELNDGRNLIELIAIDKSENKTIVKKEVFAELNPVVELFDEFQNALVDSIITLTGKPGFTGYTRPLSLVKIFSEITKLESAAYSDENGYFYITLPQLYKNDTILLSVRTRAGHLLIKKVKI